MLQNGLNINNYINEQDKKTYKILLKYNLDCGNITQSTYYTEMCMLKKQSKKLTGLNKTAFDFIRLCENSINGKSLFDIIENVGKIDKIINEID